MICIQRCLLITFGASIRRYYTLGEKPIDTLNEEPIDYKQGHYNVLVISKGATYVNKTLYKKP